MIIKRHRQFFRERREIPFDWAANNCGLFCADYILHMTGEDKAAAFRDLIKDEDSARALIAEHGTFLDLVTEILGPPLPINLARKGAVCYRAFDDGDEILGICDGGVVVNPTNQLRNQHVCVSRLDKWEWCWNV